MAYNTATLVEKEVPELRKDSPFYDGRVYIVAKFSGNAGEPDRFLRYTVGPSDTLQTIQQWAIGVAENLNKTKSIVDVLTVGQSVNLTPIASPPPTEAEIWMLKVRRYLQLVGGAWSGAIAIDLAALKADIESTYKQGFI